MANVKSGKYQHKYKVKTYTESPVGYLLTAAEESQTAKVIINAFLADLFYLPYFCVDNLAEKITVERHLNQLLNLDRAVAEGHISQWTIVWKRLVKTHWPQIPLRVRVYVPKKSRIDFEIPIKLINEMNRIKKEGLFNLQNLE